MYINYLLSMIGDIVINLLAILITTTLRAIPPSTGSIERHFPITTPSILKSYFFALDHTSVYVVMIFA